MIGKVSDHLNILSRNKNFQATLNTRVLILLPLKLFRMTNAIDTRLRYQRLHYINRMLCEKMVYRALTVFSTE